MDRETGFRHHNHESHSSSGSWAPEGGEARSSSEAPTSHPSPSPESLHRTEPPPHAGQRTSPGTGTPSIRGYPQGNELARHGRGANRNSNYQHSREMSSDTSYRYHNTPHRQQRTSRQHLWTPRVDDQLYPQQDQLLIQHHHPYTESQHGRTMHESDEAYPNQASHRVPRVGYRDVHENYGPETVSQLSAESHTTREHDLSQRRVEDRRTSDTQRGQDAYDTIHGGHSHRTSHNYKPQSQLRTHVHHPSYPGYRPGVDYDDKDTTTIAPHANSHQTSSQHPTSLQIRRQEQPSLHDSDSFGGSSQAPVRQYSPGTPRDRPSGMNAPPPLRPHSYVQEGLHTPRAIPPHQSSVSPRSSMSSGLTIQRVNAPISNDRYRPPHPMGQGWTSSSTIDDGYPQRDHDQHWTGQLTRYRHHSDPSGRSVEDHPQGDHSFRETTKDIPTNGAIDRPRESERYGRSTLYEHDDFERHHRRASRSSPSAEMMPSYWSGATDRAPTRNSAVGRSQSRMPYSDPFGKPGAMRSTESNIVRTHIAAHSHYMHPQRFSSRRPSSSSSSSSEHYRDANAHYDPGDISHGSVSTGGRKRKRGNSDSPRTVMELDHEPLPQRSESSCRLYEYSSTGSRGRGLRDPLERHDDEWRFDRTRDYLESEVADRRGSALDRTKGEWRDPNDPRDRTSDFTRKGKERAKDERSPSTSTRSGNGHRMNMDEGTTHSESGTGPSEGTNDEDDEDDEDDDMSETMMVPMRADQGMSTDGGLRMKDRTNYPSQSGNTPNGGPSKVNYRGSKTKESKNHQCSKCDKRFSRPSQLKTHSFTHSGEKPHQCPTCHKFFNVASNLKRHIRTHSNTKRKCTKNGSTVFRTFEHGFPAKSDHRSDVATKGSSDRRDSTSESSTHPNGTAAPRRQPAVSQPPADRLRWMNTETPYSGFLANHHQKGAGRKKGPKQGQRKQGSSSSTAATTQQSEVAATLSTSAAVATPTSTSTRNEATSTTSSTGTGTNTVSASTLTLTGEASGAVGSLFLIGAGAAQGPASSNDQSSEPSSPLPSNMEK